MSKDFCSLHTHTSYSALDGASKIKELVKRAKELGMSSLGISDHGVVAGIPEFYKTCKKEGIRPVLGSEFYFSEDRFQREGVKAKGGGDLDGTDKRYMHLSVYAATTEGYYNMIRLSSDAYINGFYYKPRTDYSMIENHGKGLIIGSGCLGGPVLQPLLRGDYEGGLRAAANLRDAVEDGHFFIELMDHGLQEQKTTNPQLLQIAKSLGVRAYVSQDTHYTHQCDSAAHDALLCLNTGAKIADKNRFRFHNDQYYLKSPDEMYNIFRDNPELCDNTLYIAEMCDVELDFDTMHLPVFPYPEGFESDSAYLRHLVWERAHKFYPEMTEEISQRINYELNVYETMGVSSYMLIVWDIVNHASEQGFFMSPGRGCLTKDTLVQTSRGLVKLNEVKVGDKVVSHTGVYKDVLNVHEYPISNEPLLEIKSYYGGPRGVEMTLDHKVLAVRKHENNLDWIEAKDLNVGDWMFVPNIERDVVDVDIIDLADFAPEGAIIDGEYITETVNVNASYPFSTKDVKRRYGLYQKQETLRNYIEWGWINDDSVLESPIGHNLRQSTFEKIDAVLRDGGFSRVSEWLDYVSERSVTVRKIKRFISVDSDYCDFIGRLCSNGWLTSTRSSYGIATQRSKDDMTTRDLFSRVFNDITVKYFDHSKSDLRQYTGCSKTVYNFLQSELVDYRFTAQTKHLPVWMLDLPDEKLVAIRDGLWWGDGSYSDRNKYTSTSWVLIEQLYTILRHLGIPAGLKEDNRIDSREEFKNAGRSWSIVAGRDWGFSVGFAKAIEGGFLTRIHDIKEIECGDFVYDLTVADDHSYLTTSGIVHNSASGSIVSYILGVTGVDPIRYGLIFERFLNPSRIALPDVDMDFPQGAREHMINYTVEKYGQDHVSYIATYGMVKARSAVRDAARVLGLEPREGDRISKMIPPLVSGFDTSLEECFELNPRNQAGYDAAEELRQDYAINDTTREIVDTARQLEGLLRSYGAHAAGIIVGDRPLIELVPLWKNKDDLIISQYDKNVVEDMGLVKMDFLGLKNLDILGYAESLVGNGFKLSEQPMDDYKTFNMLGDGFSLGCFQIDSSGLQALLRRMRPGSIEDLAAALALYRPGPMAQNWHNMYADRKNGREPIDYFHPDAVEILSGVYGIPLYQENVLQLARQFAGYSMAEADMLRKIIGKKIPQAMEAERSKFVEGCVANGYDYEFGVDLFSKIEGFSLYGFNASHAFSYAFITYWTAFMKANYPREYMAALLTYSMDDLDRVALYVGEARRLGLKVYPPDLSSPTSRFTIESDGIRVGMGTLKGVGEKALQKILDEGSVKPFSSLEDFIRRTNPNVTTIKALASAGALEKWGTRQGISVVAENILDSIRKEKKKVGNMESLFGDEEIAAFETPAYEFSFSEILELEKEYLGIYISGHPLDEIEPTGRRVYELSESPEGAVESVLTVVSSVDVKTTKKGDRMASLVVEDQTGAVNVICFPKAWEEYSSHLTVGAITKMVLKANWDTFREERNYVLLSVDIIEKTSYNEGGLNPFQIFLPRGFKSGSRYMSRMKGIFLEHKGNLPVEVYISRSTAVEMNSQFFVDGSDGLKDKLRALFKDFNSGRVV